MRWGTREVGRSWRRVLLGDPCCYCGAPAAAVDHIVARVQGGRDAWRNLAPACRRCNTRKSGLSLLDFLVSASGRAPGEIAVAPRIGRLGVLLVAAADLRRVPAAAIQGAASPANRLLEAMLERSPAAEAAVAYGWRPGRRSRGRAMRTDHVLHVIGTRPGGPDAGAIARGFGGGGTATRGGFSSAALQVVALAQD